MKAPLSQNLKPSQQQQSLQTSSMRGGREEIKGNIYTPNNNHLRSNNYSHGYVRSQGGAPDQTPLMSTPVSTNIYEELRTIQKRSTPVYTPNQGVHSYNPQVSAGSTSAFRSITDRNQKDEPFSLKYQARADSRQNFMKTTASIEDRPDQQVKQSTLMSSTDQFYYRPQLDQSPQLNQRSASSSQRKDTFNPAQQRSSPTQPSYRVNHSRNQHLNQKDSKSLSTNKDYRQSSSAPVDMENIIINLHNKMKNLENKYIDLANFYKRELISKGKDDEQNRYKSNQQYRSKSPYQKEREIDTNQEFTIINDLRQEKLDLESELEQMINIQSRLQEDEMRLQERLEEVEKENFELKSRALSQPTRSSPLIPPNQQSSSQETLQKLEQLRKQISGILNKFEKEFLDFINSNYSSFTENDVLGLFGSLRRQIENVVDSVFQKVDQRVFYGVVGVQEKQSVVSDQALALEDQRKQLIEQYKKDISELELNQDYSLQNFKKCAFELQNKQETVKLDIKKLGLTLNSLAKSSDELSISFQQQNGGRTSAQNFFQQQQNQPPRSSSQMRRQGGINDPSGGVRESKTIQSPQSQSQQLRLANEIKSQVQTLNIIYNEMNSKLHEGDKDLRNLAQIEGDNSRNIVLFKNGIQQFIEQLNSIRLPQNSESSLYKRQKSKNSVDSNFDMVLHSEDEHSNYINPNSKSQQPNTQILQRQINDCKQLNDKLQRDFQISSEQYNIIKSENNQLLKDLDLLKRQLDRKNAIIAVTPIKEDYESRYGSNYSSNKKRASSTQPLGGIGAYSSVGGQYSENNQLQNKCNTLDQENQNQLRQIKMLTRQIEDKNSEIEKLFTQNSNLRQITAQNLDQTVIAQDQINYFQNSMEQQREKLKLVVKQAHKFIYAMKKLQKAVHAKKPNVIKEKDDFEITRKELEGTLKILKKEFEQTQPERDERKEHNQSLDNRYYQQRELQPHTSQINQYQSNALNANNKIYERAASSSKKQTASLTQPKPQVHQSFNMTSANPYVFNQNNSLHHTQILDNEPSNQRSPIILRQSYGRVEPFRSIETIDRGNGASSAFARRQRSSLISSAEKPEQRSPVQQRLASGGSVQDSRMNSVDETYLRQLKSLQKDYDQLRQDFNQITFDKDMLKRTNNLHERDKEQLSIDKQQLEQQLDRERRRYELTRREISDLELEKEALLQEFKRNQNNKSVNSQGTGGNKLSSIHIEEHHSEKGSPDGRNNATQTQLQIRLSKVEEEFEIQERMNQEFKRTIQFLEESSEVAKQTIGDLKESIAGKDFEIEDLKVQMNKEAEKGGQYHSNESEQRKIKAQIEEQIELVCQENDRRFEELIKVIENKESDISKIKRTFERKIKEREMQQSSQNEQEFQNKIKDLQNQVKDLEEKGNQEQLESLRKQLFQKEQSLVQLKQKLQQDLSQQEQSLKVSHDKDIQAIEGQHKSQIDQLLQQNQQKLKTQEDTQKQQIQKAQQESTQKITQVQDQHKKQIDILQATLQQQDQTSKQKLQETQQKLSNLENEKSQLNKQIQDLSHQLNGVKAKLQSKEEEDPQIQIQLDQLKSQHKQSMDKLQDQLKQKDIHIKQLDQDMKAQEKQSSNEKSNLEKQSDELTKKLEEYKRILREKESGSQSLVSQIQEEKDKEIKNLNDKIKKIEQSKDKEIESKQQELLKVQNFNTQLQSQLKQEQDSNKNQVDQLKSHFDNIQQEFEQKIQVFQNENAVLTKNKEILTKDNQRLVKDAQTQIQDKIKEIQNLQNQIKSSNKEKEVIVQEIKKLEEINKDLNANLEQAQKEIHKNQASDKQNKAEIQEKLQNINNLQSQISQQEQQIKQLQSQGTSKTSDLQKQIDDLYNQLNGKDEQLNNFKSQYQTLGQQLKERDESIQQFNEQYKELNKSLNDQKQAFEKQILTYKTQVKDISSEKEALQKELNDRLKEKDEYINLEKENSKTMSQQISLQVQQVESKLMNEKSNTQKLQQTLQANNEQIQAQDKLIRELQGQISDYKNELSNFDQVKQELEDLQSNKVQQESSIEQEKLTLKTQLNQKSNENNQLKQQLKDLEDESKYSKSIRQSLEEKIQQVKDEIQDKEQEMTSKEQNLMHELKKKEETIQKKNKEIKGLQEQCEDLESQVEAKTQEIGNLMKQNQQQSQELKNNIQKLDEQIVTIKKEQEQLIAKKDQQLRDMQIERDKANEQLKDMIQQTKVDKDSLEEKLQTQLNDTITRLQQKEKEVSEKQKQLDSQQKEINELNQQINENQGQLQQAQDQLDQMQDELNEAEETKAHNQQTLEKNRDVINKLRDEVSKVNERANQKTKDQEQSQGQREKELLNENNLLKDQVQRLKSESEDKQMDLQMKVDELESELKIKENLVEEADIAIQDFFNEKHNIKAKIKHLMSLFNSQQEESSYKEDEDLELEECFDKMESEILKHKKEQDSQIQQLELDNTALKTNLISAEQELQDLQGKYGEVQCDLMNAMNKQENNDLEIRKQLDMANRKVTNYKEKLIEKQKQINQLENDKKQEKKEVSFQEYAELLEKIQKLSQENQQLKQSRGNSPNESHDELSGIKLDINRLNHLEEQAQQLKKSLLQAKDQVIDSVTETFAKKIKELQQTYTNDNLLKSKLQQLNVSQKEWNSMIREIKRVVIGQNIKLLVVQARDDKVYVLDENKLTEAQLQLIRSYIPSQALDETRLDFDEKQEKIIENLEAHIKEMKEERQDIMKEISQFKQKALTGHQFDLPQNDVEALDEDVRYLTSENNEIRLKIKDLSIQNQKLKVRVIELNEIIQDLTHKSGNEQTSKRLLLLLDENEKLKKQLNEQPHQPKKKSSRSNKQDQEEETKKIDEGSFLVGIKNLPGGGAGSNMIDFDEDNNIFDQSSIEGVIENLEGRGGGGSDRQTDVKKENQKMKFEIEELKKQNRNLTQEVQKSKIEQNPSDISVLDHIKGTFIQFLRNCPLTEKNNEELLAIVFSMMGFTKEEIQDVQQYRQKMRMSSQQSTDPDDDAKKKAKKGILGIFQKKEKELSLTRPIGSGGNLMSPSPMKPIKKN